MLAELSRDEHELLARIAHRSYIDRRTQGEIASEFGMSRPKVQRLLERARSAGVVEIHIEAPPGLDLDLESRLVETFGLTDAIVSPQPSRIPSRSAAGSPAARPATSSAASATGLVVAVSHGRTPARSPASSDRPAPIDCVFASAMGGSPRWTRRPTRTRSAGPWPSGAAAGPRACTPRPTSRRRGARGLLAQEAVAHDARDGGSGRRRPGRHRRAPTTAAPWSAAAA